MDELFRVTVNSHYYIVTCVDQNEQQFAKKMVEDSARNLGITPEECAILKMIVKDSETEMQKTNWIEPVVPSMSWEAFTRRYKPLIEAKQDVEELVYFLAEQPAYKIINPEALLAEINADIMEVD